MMMMTMMLILGSVPDVDIPACIHMIVRLSAVRTNDEDDEDEDVDNDNGNDGDENDGRDGSLCDTPPIAQCAFPSLRSAKKDSMSSLLTAWPDCMRLASMRLRPSLNSRHQLVDINGSPHFDTDAGITASPPPSTWIGGVELGLELELDPRHDLIPVQRLDGLYARQRVDHSAGHLIERLLCGESARSGQEET
jgi:hypothetical protein